MQYLEQLEQRMLLAATPDVYEQYLITLINRARANPAAEAARYKVALNEGVPADEQISTTPKQPLALNANLQQAAADQSHWMLDAGRLSHTGANGSTQFDRDLAAGYVFNAPSAWAENIGFSGRPDALPDAVTIVERLHRNFIVDSGVDARTHRTILFDGSFREIGAGLASGNFADPAGAIKAWMLTEDFAFRTGLSFITGVIFADTMKKDGFYTPYEGFGQVNVTATSSAGAVYRTQSWDAGGYSLQVPPGTYRLVFSGGLLPTPIVRENIVVTTENILQDVNATAMPGIPSLKSGTLRITGTAGDDAITVEALTDRVRVTANSGTWYAPRKSVKRIEIHGGSGRDTIDIHAGLLTARVYGDDGNDSILGGDGADQLRGGPGDDTIGGRLGRDAIFGEDGADDLLGGGDNDAIYGGAGDDTLFGGAGNDKLKGDAGNDRLDGEAGNDQIAGGLGSDTLIGGAGNDTLSAKDKAIDTLVTGMDIDKTSRDALLDVVTTVAP